MKIFDTALEGIDFQENSPLAVDILAAVKKLRQNKVVDQRIMDKSGLAEIIQKHTGLNITRINMVTWCPAATTIPRLGGKNNPMVSMVQKFNAEHRNAAKILNKDKVFDGTVNLKTGKVSGDFTKLPIVHFYFPEFFEEGSWLTAEELTAIILHETGHSLVFLEMIARHTRTNYIIKEATDRLLQTNTSEQRMQIFREVEDAFDEKLDGMEDLAVKRRDADVYRMVFLGMAIEESKSQHGENLYDYKAFEVLADQFAIRHGYGRYLATGLDKMERRYGRSPEYMSPTTYRIMMLLEAVLMLTTIAVIGVTAGGVSAFMLAVHYTLCATLPTLPLIEPHPRQKERLFHIRNELNNFLKKAKDKKAIAKALEDIKVIDALEEGLRDQTILLDYVYRNITPWGRKQVNLRKVQLEMNELVNNRLFEASARLATV